MGQLRSHQGPNAFTKALVSTTRQAHVHVCSIIENEGTAGQETLAEERVDMGVPNEGWTEESKQLFDELLKLTESKEWLKHKSFAKGSRSKALFSRTPSVGRPGQILEYAFFINSTQKLLKGVIQFGPQTEGPPGHAHGGSIATMIDAACGVLVYVTLPGARVTANMNIDYRRPTPLMKTMSIEAQVGEVIRRKTYVKCKLSSADGETLHAEATVLFVSIDPSIITK
ncbi:acyl-coenzyme A thioesterase THEM4-like isoform X1 [Ptychodera flava]|uniref:acyl-coenzyme A thioesterase THEM4-like isoform X1 n=1 Tax=Ptychodera flava TaxID=63121 RepID=UPI00396AA001